MRNLYQEVTDRILAELEAGTLPWVKPWSQTPGRNTPLNAVTRREYHGINHLLLLPLTQARGWSAPWFLTYQQAREAGGHVCKGEHGTQIVIFKDVTKKEEVGEGEDPETYHMIKFYHVFNIDQCEGLPDKIITPRVLKPRHHDAPDLLLEEFLIATGAGIHEGPDVPTPIYRGIPDQIQLPPRGAFKSNDEFYNTTFHELIHWTGHASRLDRKFDTRFVNPAQRYAAEELVAELGAAFLCAEFAIDGDMRSAGYIAGWVKLLKHDPRAIFTCASRAQAAVDYLRDRVLAAPAEAAE